MTRSPPPEAPPQSVAPLRQASTCAFTSSLLDKGGRLRPHMGQTGAGPAPVSASGSSRSPVAGKPLSPWSAAKPGTCVTGVDPRLGPSPGSQSLPATWPASPAPAGGPAPPHRAPTAPAPPLPPGNAAGPAGRPPASRMSPGSISGRGGRLAAGSCAAFARPIGLLPPPFGSRPTLPAALPPPRDTGRAAGGPSRMISSSSSSSSSSSLLPLPPPVVLPSSCTSSHLQGGEAL